MGRENMFQEIISKYCEVENHCLNVINEFLKIFGFKTTVEAFNKECVDLNFGALKPVPEKGERITTEAAQNILKLFDEEDCIEFFKVWETVVPASIKSEAAYKKLTFSLHVHFAVLPLRQSVSEVHINEAPSPEDYRVTDTNIVGDMKRSVTLEENGTNKTGMEALRTFLELKGSEFSTEPEFLSFYALPFVSDPIKHPSFKEIFLHSWVNSLHQNLENFVITQCWGDAVSPELYQMCQRPHQQLPQTSTSDEATIHTLHCQLLEADKNLKIFRNKYNKLNKDHHDLIGITAELTGALESSVKGHPVNLQNVLINCAKIFPELFKSPSSRILLSSEHSSSEQTVANTASAVIPAVTMQAFDLDFRKLKHHLASANVKTRLLLFQALRWRLTKSGCEERDAMLGAYIRHDLLLLHPSRHRATSLLLELCLAPPHASTPHPLQQAAARLVNALASTRCGRDYLCSAGSAVLRVLVPLLKGDIKTDPVTGDMILATLQKLSLRYNQRVGMIEAGLVEWLVHRLSADAKKLKTYALEYSTALLMNLCLHQRAKERCVPMARVALRVLVDLLGTELTQAVPYVNGTLYSLLANSLINAEAKRMGLCKVLEYYLKNSEGEMHRQVEYILKLHRGNNVSDHNSVSDDENFDEDTEEIDLLEEELDADDPVRSNAGELSGDQLLYQQYRLLFPYHGVVHPTATHSNEPMARPTTPRLRPLSRNGTIITRSVSRTESFCSETEVRNELLTMDSSSPDSTTLIPHGDTMVVENLESEGEKEQEQNSEEAQHEDEDQVVVSSPQSEVASKQPSGDSKKVKSEGADEGEAVEEMAEAAASETKSEDRDDEYSEAFGSRPRIPRTPTLKRTPNYW